MADDIEADIRAHQQELSNPAATLFAVQRVYGDQVREQTMRAYGRLVDTHLLVTGVLGTALLRVNGKVAKITSTNEERNALFASFVIGLEVCEDAIAEGRYLQAHALLRQEMETVAQLTAISQGKRKDGKTSKLPKRNVLEESLARLNGDLSAAAHVAKHHVVRTATALDLEQKAFPGPTSGTRYFPALDEGLARRSFSLHLILILRMIEELNVDLDEQHNADGFTEREVEAVNLALHLMRVEGMIASDDCAPS